MIRASLLALTMLWSLAAYADVTIRNFDGGGIARDNQIAKVDVNGDELRSDNEGPIVQWPGDPLFYMYGVDATRPDLFWTLGNFGGFVVYTSPDLVQWTPAGGVDGLHMVDPNITAWHDTCKNGAYDPNSACWLPRPLFSAGLGKYVLWFNNANQNFSVLCDTKVGGCAAPGAATACQISGKKSQNGNPFIDTDTGTGYIVYSVLNVGPNFDTYVQQLNANYTDCVGAPTLVVANTGEVPSMFKRGSTFYVVQSAPLCGFCSGVPSYYYTATNPLGTWSTATRFDTSNACGTQHNITSKLVIGGNDVYLYTAFFWDPGAGGGSGLGQGSQTLSNQFWVPLTFAGTAINTFTCPATFTLTGLNPAPPPAMMNVDQTDENAPANSLCDINSVMQRAQTFTPSRSAKLNEIWVRTGSGNANCYFQSCPNAAQGATADLIVTLKATSGGQPTGAALATMTLPAVGRPWGSFRQKLAVPGNVSVVAGTQYAIVMSSTATIGCWTFMYSNTNPYAGGNSLYSTNGGSTWTAQSGGDLMFSTVLDTGAPGGKGWFR